MASSTSPNRITETQCGPQCSRSPPPAPRTWWRVAHLLQNFIWPLEGSILLLQDDCFTFMHLADAFIQSDLRFQTIRFCHYVRSLGIEPTTVCAANAMLYHWATGTLCISFQMHNTFFYQLHILFRTRSCHVNIRILTTYTVSKRLLQKLLPHS